MDCLLAVSNSSVFQAEPCCAHTSLLSLVCQRATLLQTNFLIHRLSHRYFLRSAGDARATREVLRFLQLLPQAYADVRTFNMGLHACVKTKDLKTALKVVDMMTIRRVPLDHIHSTTLIRGKQ